LLTPSSQRAFRERKERHVRELEAKLSALENSTHSLQSDNERLKVALQRARTENDILRATSGGQYSPPTSRPVSASYPSPGAHLPDEEIDDENYKVQSLLNGNVLNSADKDHPASRRKTKGKEVPAAQTWDLIQSHPLVKQGLVDIADVCERLKGAAKCDGHGPVFEESDVWRAVEESRRGGGDELI
jgi:AP-1-like factor